MALLLFLLSAWFCAVNSLGMDKRQDSPVDPGVPADCTFFDTPKNPSHDCRYFEQLWGLGHQEFVEMNPSVKEDCSGLTVGHSYCVELNYGVPPPNTIRTTQTSISPSSTGSAKPFPTQNGLASDCARYYKAVDGDTCDSIVHSFGTFKFSDFLTWNPAVGERCSFLIVDYFYCVGVSSTPSSPITTPPSVTDSAKPSPTHEGLITTCNSFYLAIEGDSCDSIFRAQGLASFAQFKQWNPSVGDNCSNLLYGYYYCVGVPGAPSLTSTQQPDVPISTQPPSPTGPSPTESGIVSTCNRYHKVVSGDSCDGIVSEYGAFSLKQFYSWNPALQSSCAHLKLDYYYCIGVPGTPTVASSRPLPSPTCTTAPTPTQPGASCSCKRWHDVVGECYCDCISSLYRITRDNFHLWNPNVGRDCSKLFPDHYVCVGM